MVNLYVNGRTFESVKQSESVARVTVAFGSVSVGFDLARFSSPSSKCLCILSHVDVSGLTVQVYRVGQIKGGQCSFFCCSKTRFREF